jgi:hypothetical protein
MRKLYHATLIACLAIITFAVLLAMYMLTDGIYFNPPITLSNQGNVTTTQQVYHLGDEVEATLTYCKNRKIGGTIDWQLVDTYVRFYSAQDTDLPLGCHSYIMDLGKIPGDVLGESYHFTGLLTFKINSLTTVSYPLESNVFTVVTP